MGKGCGFGGVIKESGKEQVEKKGLQEDAYDYKAVYLATTGKAISKTAICWKRRDFSNEKDHFCLQISHNSALCR